MTQNTSTPEPQKETAMSRREKNMNAEIKALQFAFGQSTIEGVDLHDGYNRRHLAEISSDYHRAQNENLVFEVSFGTQVTDYLTPDAVIKRFEGDLPFSNSMHEDGVYSLITPREAIEKVQNLLSEDGQTDYDKDCYNALLKELEAFEKTPHLKQVPTQKNDFDFA